MASDNVYEQQVVIKFYTLLGKSFLTYARIYTQFMETPVYRKVPFLSGWNRFKEGRDTTKKDKRKVRPVTVSNERKVAEIQEYILEDKRITVENVAEHFGISYGTAQDIMSNKLGMRRVSARWVPRLLLPEQMGVRVKMCNDYCRQYNDESDTFLNRVVTCDETWKHFFEPESKQQSSVWKHPSSPSLTKALISKSAGKGMAIIFCDIQGITLNHFVLPKTIMPQETIMPQSLNLSCCRRLKESAHTLRGLGFCCTMITRQFTAAVLQWTLSTK